MKRKQSGRLATIVLALTILTPTAGAGEEARVYVGSETCRECHPDHYERFTTHTKKARSYRSVERMKKGLTDGEIAECYRCHTTGYRRPGGFVSAEATPHLRNAGCEVCHGPGSLHADTGDPADIVATIGMESCEECHDTDRVAAFDFKPLTNAGAH